jgi:glycerophosphoryl diester phosphodiesterase
VTVGQNSSPIGYELVAHRGNALEFPENTLPAFASALALGVRYLELDVQLSADQVPMVLHDHELLRTTGARGTVFERTAAQLVTLAAGEPQRLGERFHDVWLPRLDEVLALLRQWPGVTLFVEIKRASLRRFGQTPVLDAVLEAIATLPSQCVVISFDLPAVTRARERGAQRIGWVLPDWSAATRVEAEALRPDFLFGDVEQLPAGELWRGPWRWAIYEVEEPETAAALAARGAQLIETMAVRRMCTG